MNKMNKTVASILIIGLAMVSCKKEGCTDVDATNYDASAKKDNGACEYEGSNVLWYDEDVADYLIGDDAVSLTYYVDNTIVGSSAANIYWNGTPDCGQNSSITVTKDLGHVKTQAYSYKVVDQSGWVYWKGTLNFNANQCIAWELK